MEGKIVVDTSVFVSALIGSQGPSREIIRRCLQNVYKPLISNALFHEYEDVCQRSEIQNKCSLTQDEIAELLNAYYSICHWVPIYFLWRPNSIDENDNFLIELALAGNGTHIVTNNIRDLQNIELKFPDLEIVKPEELMRS